MVVVPWRGLFRQRGDRRRGFGKRRRGVWVAVMLVTGLRSKEGSTRVRRGDRKRRKRKGSWWLESVMQRRNRGGADWSGRRDGGSDRRIGIKKMIRDLGIDEEK